MSLRYNFFPFSGQEKGGQGNGRRGFFSKPARMENGDGPPLRDDLIRDIEQFLYHEARLLDARRLSEWLDLFTDDVRYWMPVRSTRYPRNSKGNLHS